MNKQLLLFFFCLSLTALPLKLLATDLDSMFNAVLTDRIYKKAEQVDFSAIFFDVETKMPQNVKMANAYEAYILAGMEAYNKGNYLVALQVFNNISDHEIYRDKDEEMLVNYYLGICFNRLGNLPLALYYIEKMIQDLEEHPISASKQHQLYSSYASMKLREEELDKAMEYFKKCLAIALEANDSLLILRSYNNLGVGLMRQNKNDSALYFFQKIQHDAFKKHQAVLHAFGYGNAGSVLQKLSDTLASVSLLQKEIKLLNEIGTTEGLFSSYISLGNAYKHLQKIDSSKNAYTRALSIAEDGNNFGAQVTAYELLLKLMLDEKKYNSIDRLYDNYLNVKNDRRIEIEKNNRKSVEQMSKIVDMSRKSLTKKNEIKTLSLEKQRLIYLIASLSLIVLLLFVIVFYNINSRKKIQQKNAQLAEKNQALKDSFVTISKTNHQNELLLREVHHRVKNNLQMLISMFNLQKNKTNDEKLKGILNQAQDRLQSIALVHQKVYQNNDFEFIDLKSYVKNLINSLTDNAPSGVIINQQIDSVNLNISKVIPLGLILCELITNSFKHAKPQQQELEINLSAQLKGENTVVIAYNDNGSFNDKKSQIKSDSSVGMTLIELFAEQLNAQLSFNQTTAIKGFHSRIEIPINNN